MQLKDHVLPRVAYNNERRKFLSAPAFSSPAFSVAPADVIPSASDSETADLVAPQRTQHSIVVRPTTASAISTDIILQTIVQHCRTSYLELTATCFVKLRLSVSLLSSRDLKLICFYCFL